jgi:hypothetical protein
MSDFFLDLYKKLNKMEMNGRDLDSILNALPWKIKETKADGTVVYECEIKDE